METQSIEHLQRQFAEAAARSLPPLIADIEKAKEALAKAASSFADRVAADMKKVIASCSGIVNG